MNYEQKEVSGGYSLRIHLDEAWEKLVSWNGQCFLKWDQREISGLLSNNLIYAEHCLAIQPALCCLFSECKDGSCACCCCCVQRVGLIWAGMAKSFICICLGTFWGHLAECSPEVWGWGENMDISEEGSDIWGRSESGWCVNEMWRGTRSVRVGRLNWDFLHVCWGLRWIWWRLVKDDSESFGPPPSRQTEISAKMPALIVSIVNCPMV